MYRLLVADDEQIVLDSIRYIIEKNFKEAVLVETSRSSREALEKVEYFKPDIIFMDIKMPGINGIEAIKEIKAYYSSAVFVIITAYEQFDYAKEAVNLGVMEYLLKPVNRNKIVETVQKALQIIDGERKKRKKELELKEKFENILPVLEHGFIHSIVLPDDYSKELDTYREIFELTVPGGCIMTLEFGQEESPGNLGNRVGSGVVCQKHHPYFREVIKSRCKCMVGPVMLNRTVVYVPSDACSDEYAQRVEMMDIAQFVQKKLRERVTADFYIGIGRICSSFKSLADSYQDSLKAIRHADNRNNIVHMADLPETENLTYQYLLSREKHLMKKISAGDVEGCIQDFNEIYRWLASEHCSDIKCMREGLIELMVVLHRLAYDWGVKDEELERPYGYLAGLFAIEDVASLRAWCIRKLKHIAAGMSTVKNLKLSNVILKAKEYIDSNYSRDITLEEVAKEVNMSPQYFCKLFKEETRENFIDYLTHVRISKAKEYLEKGSASVKEICFDIGYSDPNYFSRLFKKVTGYTPTEYKDRIPNRL